MRVMRAVSARYGATAEQRVGAGRPDCDSEGSSVGETDRLWRYGATPLELRAEAV